MNELDPERDRAASGLLLRDDPDLDLRPGGSAVIEVAIRTESRRTERVDLSVGGPLAPWATIEPAHLTIKPGDDHSAMISFHLPVEAGLPAGPTGFTVEVVPRTQARPEHSNGHGETQGWVTEGMAFVLPLEAHRLELVPGRRRVRVEATNEGNVSLVLQLEATPTSGDLSVTLEDESLVMAPGATAVTWLRLDGEGTYRVEARSSDGVVAGATGSSGHPSPLLRPRAQRAPRPAGAAASTKSLPKATRKPSPKPSPEPVPTAPKPAAPAAPTPREATSTLSRVGVIAVALAVLSIGNLVGVVVVGRPEPSSSRLVPGGLIVDPRVGHGTSVVPPTTAPLATLTTTSSPAAGAPGDPLVTLTDVKGQRLPAPVPLPGTPPAGKVALVHRLFDVAHSDYVFTATASDLAAAKKKGLVDQGVLGQIEVSKLAGTVALREFVNPAGLHRFTQGDPEHAAALADGYKEVQVVGWMFLAPVEGALALYRATLGAVTSLTTSPVEQQNQVAAGWTDKGIIAYLVG